MTTTDGGLVVGPTPKQTVVAIRQQPLSVVIPAPTRVNTVSTLAELVSVDRLALATAGSADLHRLLGLVESPGETPNPEEEQSWL